MQRQFSSQDISGYLHKVFEAENWTNLEVLMNWKNLKKKHFKQKIVESIRATLL